MVFLDVQFTKLPGWGCAASYFFITSHTAEYSMRRGSRWSIWRYIIRASHRHVTVKRKEGDSKEEVPGSNPCGQGGDKDALYRWESMGGSFLNARGRTASVDLSFFLTKISSVACVNLVKVRKERGRAPPHSKGATA
eukprot:1144345-Pelagomonas_calceolata.AAC.1